MKISDVWKKRFMHYDSERDRLVGCRLCYCLELLASCFLCYITYLSVFQYGRWEVISPLNNKKKKCAKFSDSKSVFLNNSPFFIWFTIPLLKKNWFLPFFKFWKFYEIAPWESQRKSIFSLFSKNGLIFYCL